MDTFLDLKLVAPQTYTDKSPAHVKWHLEGSTLHVLFKVYLPVLHAKKNYGPMDFPYDYDVVEVFLATHSSSPKNLPYYEFEVTPYNQTFEVKISDLTQPFERGISTGAQAHAHLLDRSWSAEFQIPLEKLNWSGRREDLRGNFFGIFGAPPERTYWSLFLPPQEKAQFHKPEFFQPLFD